MLSRRKIILIVLAIFVASPGFASETKSLAEIYKSGKVRFVRELTLDEKSMPEGVVFAGPGGLACDAAGNVYVMDFSGNDIKIFDPSGEFLKLVGRKGQGPGEFNMPIDIVFAKDRLIIWDMGNRRLCSLRLSGDFIKAEGDSAYSGRPQKVSALPSGEVILETEKTYFNEPNRAQDRCLEILTPDLKSMGKVHSQVVLRNTYVNVGGRLLNVPQPFCPDFHWDVTPSGSIVVGLSGTYEIVSYGKTGAELFRISHPYDPVKVTAEDEKDFFAGMSYTTEMGIKLGAPDHIVKNTIFPKFKPAFNDLMVDSDGNVLIHTYRKNKDEMDRTFDAFDVRGKFISTVHMEGDTTFPAYSRRSRVAAGCFWLIEYSKDGTPGVSKYRIAE